MELLSVHVSDALPPLGESPQVSGHAAEPPPLPIPICCLKHSVY